MREQHALESDIEIKQDDDDRGGEDLVVSWFSQRMIIAHSVTHAWSDST